MTPLQAQGISCVGFLPENAVTGSGTCDAEQAETSLAGIFLQIAGDLTEARLVSDSTT